MPSEPIGSLLKKLLANFMNVVENIKAVLVSDSNGLIVASHLGPDLDENVLGAMSSVVQPILDKIKKDFSFKSFGTATFDTDLARLIFLDTGVNMVVTVVLDIIGSIDQAMPVSYLLTEKITRVIEGRGVQVEIPRISLKMDAESEEHRLKDHIYQMRLKGGKYRFKFVVIGDPSVGKTSIIMRFVEHKFERDYRSTIGLNLLMHTHNLLGNTEINFNIYDIGAHDFFRRVRSAYYTGTHACFIIYDITRPETYDNVQKWYNELTEFVGTLPICMIGNKADLESERKVPVERALKLAEKLEASFLETSAKTGFNVDDAFTLMAYKLVQGEQQREADIVKSDISAEIQKLFDKRQPLRIGILNEHKTWNPVLDHLFQLPILGDIQQKKLEPGKQILTFSTGVKVFNMNLDVLSEPPDMSFFNGVQGVVCVFNGRKATESAREWRTNILNLINATQPACTLLVGIQCDEEQKNQFIEELNLNPVLEANPRHSVLFFCLSQDYDLELYDNLIILLESLPGNQADGY
ncbi:MAG: small GTP-binding protein domain-containing protein, Ras family [Promethearchaeota archaeon CR_4]|nr:MAG: small GTP-binding protein domain-containing protein, Ras family [Candidatus Lokiarchaeota archaeon CR_4]